MSEDWAETRAKNWVCLEMTDIPRENIASLAALLREVYGRARSETLVMCCVCDNASAPRPECECVICHRQRTLAEVRRVVEEVKVGWLNKTGAPHPPDDISATCDEVLARLEKL